MPNYFFITKAGIVTSDAGTATTSISNAGTYVYVAATNNVGETALIGAKAGTNLDAAIDAYKSYAQDNGLDLAEVTGSFIAGDAAGLTMAAGFPEFIVSLAAGAIWNASWDFSREFWHDYYGLNQPISPLTDAQLAQFFADLRRGYYGNCQPSCRLTACDYAAILSSKSPSIFSSFSTMC